MVIEIKADNDVMLHALAAQVKATNDPKEAQSLLADIVVMQAGIQAKAMKEMSNIQEKATDDLKKSFEELRVAVIGNGKNKDSIIARLAALEGKTKYVYYIMGSIGLGLLAWGTGLTSWLFQGIIIATGGPGGPSP
jgi:hypothetical protein